MLRRGARPTSGDLFERIFATPTGEIGPLAEVRLEGAPLVLQDVAIYPVHTARLAVGVGVGTIAAIRRALATEAEGMGFDTLRITGTRLSGATPGREVDVAIDLTRRREF